MKWKFPIDDSNGEKFTCQRVCEQRAKRNAKHVNNRRKKAALKKELTAFMLWRQYWRHFLG
jgi:hypothetical protein